MTTRLLICASLWLLASTTSVAIAHDHTEEERLLKTAFIYNFTKFTRWPEKTGSGEQNTLILCVVGKNELTDELKQLDGKMVKGRPLHIQQLKDIRIPNHCNVLYVTKSEQKRYTDILESVRGSPVLTVSELPQFGSKGGIIELYREDGRLRFIINLNEARRAGLEFSSRLLNLAVVIDNREAR